MYVLCCVSFLAEWLPQLFNKDVAISEGIIENSMLLSVSKCKGKGSVKIFSRWLTVSGEVNLASFDVV